MRPLPVANVDHGRRAWSPWVRLHLPLVVGVSGCAFAGWFEWTRAVAGRQIAWVYAVEWPFFAVLGVVIWWRLWREDSDSGATPSRAAMTDSRVTDSSGADPQLVAWQDYLARLQAADPPGGPPARADRAARSN